MGVVFDGCCFLVVWIIFWFDLFGVVKMFMVVEEFVLRVRLSVSNL